MIPRPLLTLAMLAWACTRGYAEPPKLAIFWSLANREVDTIGSVGYEVTTKGWKHAIATGLRPQIEWAKEADPEVPVIAHLCFGQYGPGDDDMRIDAYDWAKASGIAKLYDATQFADAWAPIIKERTCYAYTGDYDRGPLMPANEFRLMVERNLAPYVKAGFHRVCIDASSDAITYPATVAGETISRSVNAIILSYADGKFPQPTMIEATPRRLKPWRQLAKRDVICNEATWRRRHGRPDELSGNAIVKGYGDRAYMTGVQYRIVDNAAPAQMVADARRIASEGDVPCVQGWPLMQAGVKASELLGVAK